ncbi:HesA/MoeB/ThiF family protein [Kribbella sp. C-35]|uniref:HesA/MoeB/ThiF family protein n=1 Tax=Kribbella sp. C-35 TaxID=2789276 RepID=UPI00397AF5BF
MNKPRVKDGHRPLLRPDGRIWIGSVQFGLGTEIQDASGLVWQCCQLMDGTRTHAEIVNLLTADGGRHPANVEQVIELLISSGWIEDAAGRLPENLTARDIERYGRNADLLSWLDTTPRQSRFELQGRLKAARVTILGVGGIGSAVAVSLVASGVGQVHCVDGDVVELSNLNRQTVFSEPDIGRSKVDVVIERLKRLNSDVQVTGADMMIQTEDEIARQVRGSDIFVHAIDRPQGIQRWSNRVAVELGIPWMMASYNGPMMACSMFLPGKTGCYECMRTAERNRLELAGDDDLLDARPVDGFNPVMAPTAQMSGHFGALEIIYFLAGMRVQTAGRQIHRSFLDYDHQYFIEGPRQPDCPACGDQASAG